MKEEMLNKMVEMLIKKDDQIQNQIKNTVDTMPTLGNFKVLFVATQPKEEIVVRFKHITENVSFEIGKNFYVQRFGWEGWVFSNINDLVKDVTKGKKYIEAALEMLEHIGCEEKTKNFCNDVIETYQSQIKPLQKRSIDIYNEKRNIENEIINTKNAEEVEKAKNTIVPGTTWYLGKPLYYTARKCARTFFIKENKKGKLYALTSADENYADTFNIDPTKLIDLYNAVTHIYVGYDHNHTTGEKKYYKQANLLTEDGWKTGNKDAGKICISKEEFDKIKYNK